MALSLLGQVVFFNRLPMYSVHGQISVISYRLLLSRQTGRKDFTGSSFNNEPDKPESTNSMAPLPLTRLLNEFWPGCILKCPDLHSSSQSPNGYCFGFQLAVHPTGCSRRASRRL